jgi:hypothetical protein
MVLAWGLLLVGEAGLVLRSCWHPASPAQYDTTKYIVEKNEFQLRYNYKSALAAGHNCIQTDGLWATPALLLLFWCLNSPCPHCRAVQCST